MNQESFSIEGQIIDIINQRIYPGRIVIDNKKIRVIEQLESAPDQYIMPGFIDAHIHIESSLLVPSEFARLAVPFGTIATVSDPHEIGNVLGIDGVKYMIEDGEKVNFKFYFGAPSCVPATPFETAGDEINLDGVEELLNDDRVKFLSEMMNWPGVLNDDPLVLSKIAAARKAGKPVDGHAPGLKGEQAFEYIKHGITTDHECFTEEEAIDKMNHGMFVQIREGSAARNFEALYKLLADHPLQMMLCSDDKHPDSLVKGHINSLVKRAVTNGIDIFNVLWAACINPVKHYNLDVGLLKINDPADFIIVDNLKEFNVKQTYINGDLVAENGKSLITTTPPRIMNKFMVSRKSVEDFQLSADSDNTHDSKSSINVIEALDGELVTNKIVVEAKIENGSVASDPENDILKLAVVNRYENVPPAIGFIKNFGLKEGAIASSVGHDSHNITAVGVDDEAIAKAVNLVIENKGGLSAVCRTEERVLPLPIAGLMSDKDGYEVAEDYSKLDELCKKMGSQLSAPFMTLSFMALLVIPSIKLSDKGLFDGNEFKFINVLV